MRKKTRALLTCFSAGAGPESEEVGTGWVRDLLGAAVGLDDVL